MSERITQNITYVSALFGVLTVLLGIVLLVIFPSSAELSEGFRTPIIAFEFAKTESDIAFLSGASEQSIDNRARMDLGHIWDMFFPVAYGGFLAALMMLLVIEGMGFLKFGVLIALLIIPFDIYENMTLLKITEALTLAIPVDLLLIELQVATWLKWGCIGISAAMLAIGYTFNKAYVSAVFSYLAAISILICRISDAEPLIAEAMSIMTFLLFLWLVIKTFRDLYYMIKASRTHTPR